MSPKDEGHETRLCTLFCYGKPDPERVLPRSHERVTWYVYTDSQIDSCTLCITLFELCHYWLVLLWYDDMHRSLPIEFEQKAVRGEIEGVEPGQSNFFTMW